jgi:hypothetical protein
MRDCIATLQGPEIAFASPGKDLLRQASLLASPVKPSGPPRQIRVELGNRLSLHTQLQATFGWSAARQMKPSVVVGPGLLPIKSLQILPTNTYLSKDGERAMIR